MDWLIDGINQLIEVAGASSRVVMEMLPESPLAWHSDIDNKILSWVNWLIPVGEMVVVFEGVLICVGVYYVVRIALHWLKIAGS